MGLDFRFISNFVNFLKSFSGIFAKFLVFQYLPMFSEELYILSRTHSMKVFKLFELQLTELYFPISLFIYMITVT